MHPDPTARNPSRASLLLGAWAFSSLVASAATFTVTKTTDTNDGACDVDCSPREAVIAANLQAGPDVILLGIGEYRLSIAGTGADLSHTGDLDILQALEIRGVSSITTVIDAAGVTSCPFTDQRGIPRPQDGDLGGTAQCDVGAFEYGGLFIDGLESGDCSAWLSTLP